MVDRLHDLLHAEADELEIPGPPTLAILRDGRRAGRGRLGVPALAAVAAAAAVAALAVVPRVGDWLGDGPGDPTVAVHERNGSTFTAAQATTAETAYARSGAFAAGSQVFFGDFTQGVEIEDPAVRGLYYTSAGVLVRHGKDHAMDGSTPDAYSLVGLDGSVTGLGIELGDVSPSTDPTQPYLAYAREGDDTDWEVVVLDLRDGKAAAVFPVEGDFSWGGWDAPPVALSGDRVYVSLDEETVAVTWRTGESATAGVPGSSYPDIEADRFLQVENDVSGDELDATVRVLDAMTGEVLLELPGVGDRFASLSPDGRSVMVLPYLLMDDDGQVGPIEGAVLHDVEDGRSLGLPTSPPGGYGWSPDSGAISVGPDGLTRCSLDGCSTTPVNRGAFEGGTFRLGGMVNES